MKLQALIFLSVFSLLPVDGATAAGDPAGQNNLAAGSRLPQGQGIAAEAGSKIEQHPDVIFAENFESGDFRRRWREVRDDGGVLSLKSFPNDAAIVGNRSLQVTATLGQNTGGGLTTWFESNDRVFIRFYTRFDTNCDYVHHFCTLRANRARTGAEAWSGFGGAGVRPRGDQRFSTALEPWGDWGRNSPPGKWNFYSYWHQMSASPGGKYWGNAFRVADQPAIKKDQWICAEFMIKHNTPGRPDGEQAYWIDGKLLGHWKGIDWRSSPQLQANALSIESYVTDRWTNNAVNIVFFDNIVIARQYIGPAAK